MSERETALTAVERQELDYLIDQMLLGGFTAREREIARTVAELTFKHAAKWAAQPVDAPQPCPHCKLPPVLPETCTPELGAVIDQQLEERWDLLNAGVDIGQRLAADAPQPCVWRDIATAPKDGTRILVAPAVWTAERVVSAYYRAGLWWIESADVNGSMRAFTDPDEDASHWPFTVWMPLPPVPAAQETTP